MYYSGRQYSELSFGTFSPKLIRS